MRVYRLECPGCAMGPYHCECRKECSCPVDWYKESSEHHWECGFGAFYDKQQTMNERHAFDGKHPTISKDFPAFNWNVHWEYYSGCKSEKALRKWFRGYMTWLLREGFRIRTYEANTMLIGKSKKQVAFVRGNK